LREGLFNEQDMQQLEHGYSVSDTDNENNAGLLSGIGSHDIASMRSGVEMVLGGNPLRKPQQTAEFGHYHDNCHSQPDAVVLSKFKAQEEYNALYQELANQKIKYFQKIA
jgi:hypothetical protein